MRTLRKMLGRLSRRVFGQHPGNRPHAPMPLAAGDVAGSQSHVRALLAQRPPFRVPGEGEVLVADAGFAQVALAVEGCMAIPGAGVALRGWMTDPHSHIAGLWLEIDGAFHPVRPASYMYRADVLEQRGLMEAFPGHRTGWYLFEPCDVAPGEVVVKLHAVARTPAGWVVLTSGTTATAGHRCSLDRLGNEFEAGSAGAATIAAAARPFLEGLTSVHRPVAWRDGRLETPGGKPADLAVVIAVKDNAEMIHHLLAALEACRSAGKIEVILSLQSPGLGRDVNRVVHAWRGSSPFAAIRTLVPVVPVGFGLAASGGVELAQSPAVALASDEILPPSGDWVGTALDLLSQTPQAIFIPTIATFDHRPYTLSTVFDLPWAQFEHDHSSLAELAALEPVRRSLAWSCGFLLANRDLIAAAGGLDDSLSEMDTCLLDLVLRMQFDDPARLRTLPGAFTHLRLPAYAEGDRTQRLWSLYALAEGIRRRQGEAEQRDEDKSAPAGARAEPSLSPA